MDARAGLRVLGGVARGVELQRIGVGRDNLVAHVQAGRVLRPHRGCFALPGTPRPAVLASIFRAKPACVSALIDLELPLFPAPARTHLMVPISRGPGLARARPADEVVLHRVDGVASMAGHLDLAAGCTTPMQQLALVDAALQKGLILPRDLAAFANGSPLRRAWLRDSADASAESISETMTRVQLREAGLRVCPQVVFDGIRRVDLLVEDFVVVELDGRMYHSDDTAFQRDRAGDRALNTLGYRVLRYTFMDIVRGADVVEDVVALLWREGRLTPAIRTRMNAAARVSGWRDVA